MDKLFGVEPEGLDVSIGYAIFNETRTFMDNDGGISYYVQSGKRYKIEKEFPSLDESFGRMYDVNIDGDMLLVTENNSGVTIVLYKNEDK